MPTPRKRIGFLPNVIVQDIINKICIQEKISQSKVTGMLVEEALHARGIYQYSNNSKVSQSHYYKAFDNYFNEFKDYMHDDAIDEGESFNSKIDDSYSAEDYQLLNDFIEYKRFKKMVNHIKNTKAI